MIDKPYSDPDVGKAPEQLFKERTTRLQDAMHLKQPDRIPIQLIMSYMLAEMYGVTRQEQHESGDKEIEMLEKAALYFQPDTLTGIVGDPGASLAVGDRLFRYPGHGLDANASFQFVEGEYMKAEDYDAFLHDPTDWAVRTLWPRMFTELEGLATLPPLSLAAYGPFFLLNFGKFATPPLVRAIKALGKAIEAQVVADARAVRTVERLAALGFAPPALIGSVIQAPFDFMSDTLRGMRGIM